MQLVWFRNDARTRDHAALQAALENGPTAAVFLWAGKQWRSHAVGEPRLAFLRRSLVALRDELDTLNVPLVVLSVPSFSSAPATLAAIGKAWGIRTVHALEEFPLNERLRDSHVRHALNKQRIELRLHDGGAIRSPGSVLKSNGEPYVVFTPFKRAWAAGLSKAELTPLPPPRRQASAPSLPLPESQNIVAVTTACLTLTQPFDKIDGALLEDLWPGCPREAERRLADFISTRSRHYGVDRDLPAVDGTSALSPYLSAGLLSARQALAAGQSVLDGNEGIAAWINELCWRDFYRHVIVHFPAVSKHRAFKAETDAVRWRSNAEDLAAWKAGQTGYPLVDAGMRQLNATGWMHNRLRMVCAMFLSKHLLLDWREGERYFMEQLVDGDFAANNGGWQWSSSTGTDAQPYFRIFNPITQAERFDPDGTFVLKWVPELGEIAPVLNTKQRKQFFEPWRLPAPPLTYPPPMVDHKTARERALAAFKAL